MAREFDLTIRFRATARHDKQLNDVARHLARPPSQVLRMLIEEAHARAFGSHGTKHAKKRASKPAEPAQPKE